MTFRTESRLRRVLGLSTLLALLLPCAGAEANDELRFAGFGTLGLSCFSNDDVDYAATGLQPKGPGRSAPCGVDLDSILGLQVDGGLSDRLDYSVQVISKLNAKNNYAPSLSLAVLRWKTSNDTLVRFGRTSNPNFIYSEARNIHFAMPWTRPPTELYGLSPVLVYDGVDVLYRQMLGGWEAEFHAGLSVSNEDVPVSNSNEVTDLESWQGHLNLVLERGEWLFKLGYSGGTYSLKSDAIQRILDRTVAPINASLADDIAIDDSTYHLLALGATYQDDRWLLQAEVGGLSVDSLLVRDAVGAYVTVGRQLSGGWMPYLTLARHWTWRKSEHRAEGTPIEGLVDSILANRTDAETLSLGISKALTERTLLKFQIDWVHPDDGSVANYLNLSPAYDRNDPGSDLLFSLNLDFLF